MFLTIYPSLRVLQEGAWTEENLDYSTKILVKPFMVPAGLMYTIVSLYAVMRCVTFSRSRLFLTLKSE